VLRLEYLPREISQQDRSTAPIISPELLGDLGLEATIEALEKKIIASALNTSHSNVLQAALLLKIPRGTLRYKMAKYGL
jgi:two-component system, NtrC family, response regulator AtoC